MSIDPHVDDALTAHLEHEALDLVRQRFDALWTQAHTSHPELLSGPPVLADAIARHLADALARDVAPTAWLDNLLVDDLYLAAAASRGDDVAVATLERAYRDHLHGLARRYANDTLRPDDLVQGLLEKLLVATASRPPKLSSFAGQGALRSWLKITAVRAYIDAQRAASRKEPEALVDGSYFERLVDETDDLELDFLKNTYRQAFKLAFAEAVGELSAKERNLLKHHLGGLNIDQIGDIYNVHRATAARWLAAARDSLQRETRHALQRELAVSQGELDSIMHLIESRVSVSMTRLLAPNQDDVT